MGVKKTRPWWKRFAENMGTYFYHFCLEWSDPTGTLRTVPKRKARSQKELPQKASSEKILLEKDILGLRGEDEAVRFLQKSGYVIKARNIKFSFGELDIVAQKGNCVVFVEVKTRQSAEVGGQPYEAVKPKKRRRIISLAEAYIRRFRLSQRPELVYRFDIISIVWHEKGEPEINHIENAFDASEKYPVCPGVKK